MRGQNVRLSFRVLVLASVLDGPHCAIVRLIPSQIVSARFCQAASDTPLLCKNDLLPTGNSQRAKSPEVADIWVILIQNVLPEHPECKHKRQFLSIGLLQVYATRSWPRLLLKCQKRRKRKHGLTDVRVAI